jgi:hypothetical protein
MIKLENPIEKYEIEFINSRYENGLWIYEKKVIGDP